YRQGERAGIGQAAGSRDPLAWFGRHWDRGYAGLEHVYRHMLAVSLRMRWLVILLAVVSFVGGVALVPLGFLSTEFLPSDDSGRVQVSVELPAGSSLSVTSDVTKIGRAHV